MTMIPHFIPDISVITASVPITLDGIIARGVLWQCAEMRFLLNVPEVARYLVEAGRFITIEPVPNITSQKVEHHLHMLPMAALFYQRGQLAFHAAAACNAEGTVLLSGDSGSGKSTLLAALSQRGWQVLADDLTIVDFDGQGLPTVLPARDGIALWPDSLKKLGINATSLPYADVNRREFTPPRQSANPAHLIRGIYRLNVHNKRNVELDNIMDSSRFQKTATMLYNSHVADILCDRVEYLRCAAAMVRSIEYRELRRPRGIDSVEELAELIKI